MDFEVDNMDTAASSTMAGPECKKIKSNDAASTSLDDNVKAMNVGGFSLNAIEEMQYRAEEDSNKHSLDKNLYHFQAKDEFSSNSDAEAMQVGEFSLSVIEEMRNPADEHSYCRSLDQQLCHFQVKGEFSSNSNDHAKSINVAGNSLGVIEEIRYRAEEDSKSHILDQQLCNFPVKAELGLTSDGHVKIEEMGNRADSDFNCPSLQVKDELGSSSEDEENHNCESSVNQNLNPSSRKKDRTRNRVCHVNGCTTKSPPSKLYSFPTNEKIRENWIDVCKVEERYLRKKRLYICGKHFEPSVALQSRLKPNDFPTLFTSKVFQPKPIETVCANCIDKWKMQKKHEEEIEKLKLRIASQDIMIARFEEQAKTNKDKLAEMVKNSIDTTGAVREAVVFGELICNPKRKKYSKEAQNLLLNLQYISTKYYNYLREVLKFPLPHATTLHRWTPIKSLDISKLQGEENVEKDSTAQS